MFNKKSNNSSEIMESMTRILQTNHDSKNQIEVALDQINKAAEYFDSIGEYKKADEITLFLEKIAKSKCIDITDLIKALEETGTPFHRSEYKAEDMLSSDDELSVDPDDLKDLEKLFEE